jgi:hypothetical protein
MVVLAACRLFAEGPALQTVRVAVTDGAVSVFLSANGALVASKIGVLVDPPRIYLDFPGVGAATKGLRVDADPVVRGVRVSVNQARPLVTRAVIDLAAPTSYRVDTTSASSGTITIVLQAPAVHRAAPEPPRPAPTALKPGPGAGAARVALVPPPAAAPPPDRADAPSVADAPPTPAISDIEVPRPSRSPGFASAAHAVPLAVPPEAMAAYVLEIAPYLDRIEHLRAVLVALDTQIDIPAAPLQQLVGEFDGVRTGLAAVKPRAEFILTHRLLDAACTLGAAAAAARTDPNVVDGTVRASNAAAAAAGAIMLLNRARAELGLEPGR